MASLPKPRRRSTAQLANMRRDRMTYEFLRLYSEDSDFVAEFQVLAAEHSEVLSALSGHYDLTQGYWQFYNPMWGEIETQAKYGESEAVKVLVAGVRELVTKWNLNVLPHNIGYEAVSGALFFQCHHASESVYLQYMIAHEIPYVEGEDRIDRRRPLTFTFDGRWFPSHESPGDAETRLLEEFAAFVRAEIARGIERLEAAGYAYDDSYMTGVYLGWLYRRVALREPVHGIARDVNAKSQTVETETKEYARLLGIQRIPDNKYSLRGKR